MTLCYFRIFGFFKDKQKYAAAKNNLQYVWNQNAEYADIFLVPYHRKKRKLPGNSIFCILNVSTYAISKGVWLLLYMYVFVEKR